MVGLGTFGDWEALAGSGVVEVTEGEVGQEVGQEDGNQALPRGAQGVLDRGVGEESAAVWAGLVVGIGETLALVVQISATLLLLGAPISHLLASRLHGSAGNHQAEARTKRALTIGSSWMNTGLLHFETSETWLREH